MSPSPVNLPLSFDKELATEVRAALDLRLRTSARHITVLFQDGVIILRGRVPTYFDRQLACATTRRVPGVGRVTDELQVIEESGMNPIPTAPVSIPILPAGLLRVVAPLICLAALVGCGGDGVERLPVHPVEGAITRNGKPLANALVALHPKSPDKRTVTARGQTDENGRFQVTTYDANDGAPEGEYAVTVQYFELLRDGSSAEPGPNVLNPKISSPHQTDIVVKVGAGPNKLPPIEVERR